MKQSYTLPTLSSIKEHEIKNLSSIENYEEELRLIRITGIPVALKVTKDYVELNSTEEEINLSAYKEVFVKLMNFFYGTGTIYGFIQDGNLIVYDINTNDNFFSTRDMAILEKETGLPIVKPIAEGNFTFEEILSILNEKINDEKIPADELHILPSVYINDPREWADIKPKETSKIIFGEKKAAPATTYVYYPPTTVSTTTATTKKPKEKKAKNLDDYEIAQWTTKEDRTAIFVETYKNISDYIDKNIVLFSENCLKWWKKYGKYITYFYAIHMLPNTRMILWEYSETYCLSYIDKYLPVTEKWATFFSEFLQDTYEDLIGNKISFDYYFTLYFEKIFHEELLELDKFYIKENPKALDWRYGGAAC
jgi:hypothetical protein